MIGEFIDQLAEQGEKPNPLQEAMVAFLKEELQHLLEISVEKEYVPFETDVRRLHIRLKLAGEVISSDYVTIND